MLKHKPYYLFVSVIAFGVLVAATSTFVVKAASEADIVYPVEALGGCGDKAACFKYCEDPKHLDACVRFAELHDLLPEAELRKAKKFAELKTGPGACNTEASCLAYCNDVTHINECVRYGEENGFLEGHELEEAKRVRDFVVAGGRLPGGCRTKDECERTCDSPKTKEQARECFETAKRMNLLPPEFDDEKTEKMFQLIDRGEIDFAAMKKCENLDKGGDVDGATLDQCLNIGVELGFMKPEEKDLARRMMREGGPNGCRGKACREECERNPEACIEYFEEKGIPLPAEAQEQMNRGLEQIKQAFSQAPPEVLECLTAEIGIETFNAIQAGTLRISQMARLGSKLGGVMQRCFAKAFSGEKGFRGSGGGEGFPGPGGPGGIPSEVKECLASRGVNLGDPQKPPPANLNELIRECATQFRGSFDFSEDHGFPEGGIPPAVRECLKAQGFDLERLQAPPPEEVIKKCIGQAGEERFGPPGEFPGQPGVFPGVGPGEGGFPPELLDRCRAAGKSSEECFRVFNSSESEHVIPPRPDQGLRRRQICPALPTVQDCPQGQRRVVAYESPECGTYYTCVMENAGTPPSPPDSHRCSEGSYWDGSTCLSSSGSPPPPLIRDPAEECYRSGGQWNGSTCLHPEDCTRAGGTWNGTSCQFGGGSPPPTANDPARRCAESGGSWDGATCQTANSGGSGLRISSSFFANLLDLLSAIFR